MNIIRGVTLALELNEIFLKKIQAYPPGRGLYMGTYTQIGHRLSRHLKK